jgi:Ca2+-binding EF-hand superfamily protein
MFAHTLRRVCGLHPLYARRSLATITAGGDRVRSKFNYVVGAAIAGTLIGISANNIMNDEGTWVSLKERVMTSYESRIRELSSPEKVFHVFASVQKDGKAYMTVDDFIRALVPHQFHFESKEEKKRVKSMPAAFKIADQNGDGLLSFQEYLFFVTLLSIPESSFKVAFKLMDVDGSGKVDKEEFLKVMKLVKRLSPPATQTTTEASGVAQGWLNHFFGTSGKNELTLENFTKFLRQLNQDVLQMEYNLYDRDNRGFLSQRDFGLLLMSFANPRDFFDRTTTLDSTPMRPFSFDQFQGFNELVEHIDDVEMGMQLYQLNNRPFRKQDLQRLTRILCRTELNQQVIDTIMRIFDKNGDGTLEIDEFVTAIKKRKSRGLTNTRDTGFVRTFTNIIDCVKNSRS